MFQSSYIVLYVRKRLAGNVATWHNLLGTFVFYDNAGKNFLPMLGIVFTSYLLGVATNVTLSSFGVVILPVLAFIVITKHVEYKPKLWEYFLLVTSLYCFNDSQFFFDTPRVVMLVASALGIMVVAIRLNLATKRWFASAVAYILIAFILPVLTIGYNIYVGTNCGRMRNYTDHYNTCGVMYVHHNNELGIRCRYRVVMPPQYKRIEPIITPNIYHWRINETGTVQECLSTPPNKVRC